MNIRLTIITLLIYTSIAMVIFFTIKGSHINKVQAAVFPREITINDAFYYCDSSEHATSRLWEFGSEKGNKTSRAKGYYNFRKAGRYLVKLSINNQLADTFWVNVRKPLVEYKEDTTVSIFANETGIAGQNVHFKIRGATVEWCEWYFGETGRIDGRDVETFHSYNTPGKYEVKLITNRNQRDPVFHTITIAQGYNLTQTPIGGEEKESKGGGGGSDLKQHLQKIASGVSFSTNYNYIIKTFLCQNTHVTVTINGKGGNDFYSYCQNLQLNSGVTIDNVATESDPKSGCISKLVITQH